MSKSLTVGTFAAVVLAVVGALPSHEAYGLRIKDAVEKRTGRSTSSGAVYVVLKRLEDGGLVQSSWTDKMPERGGKSRRVYAMTAAGARALDATRSATLSALAAVSSDRRPQRAQAIEAPA